MVTGTNPVDAEVTQEGLPIPDVERSGSCHCSETRTAGGAGIRFAGCLDNRKAVVGAAILLVFIVVAILAPWITQYEPDAFVARPHQAPSSEHWFGTDGSGHGCVFADRLRHTHFARHRVCIVGLRVTIVGAIVGMTAGYFRGRVDDVLSVVMNVVLIVPTIPLLVVLAAFLKPGFWTIVFVLTATGWAWGARVLRSQTLALREKDFVSSAQVAGERVANDHLPRNPAQHALDPDGGHVWGGDLCHWRPGRPRIPRARQPELRSVGAPTSIGRRTTPGC